MSWRTVVVTRPSKLDYSMGYLVVRNVESTVKIHLSEIAVLMVENTSSSVTCALLCKLTEQKIKVIFCDEKRNPNTELTPYYGSHDCSLKLKTQIAWEPVACQYAWTVIVEQKIRNQAGFLKELGFPAFQKLTEYINELEFYDASNREGMAAKVYFNALFGKSFSRRLESPVNAALNYGYSLLLSCFNREVVCSGYVTQLGLFHDNMYNQYNLSCDLMEPFRIFADRCVYHMKPEKFEKDEKHSLVALLNEEITIDGREQKLLNAVRIYAKSVFRAIEENDMAQIKFPQTGYEL